MPLGPHASLPAFVSSAHDSPDLDYFRPALDLLLIGTTLSSPLVPICGALLFFSTPRSRRQPTFILNVLMVLLGLALGVTNAYIQARSLLGLPIAPGVLLANTALIVLVPMLADCVLIWRVIIVYPPSEMQFRALATIYGPMAILKTTRIVINVVFIVTWSRAVFRNAESPLRAGQKAWNSLYPKVSWIIELFDSTYVSTIFLFRLGKGTRDALRVQAGIDAINTDSDQGGLYSRRLLTFFWISASNFVLPAIFTLAQLVLVFRAGDFLDGAYLLLVKSYVEILGVLLATIWSSGTKSEMLASPGTTGQSSGSPLRFAPVESSEDQDRDSHGTADASSAVQ